MIRISICLVLAPALACGLALGGCAAPGPPFVSDSGHLVIVGGGLEDDNAAVFNRFVELCADGPIGIIPTSSFDGVESGVSNVARWKKYSGARDVIAIPLTKDDAAKADDPAIAAMIASCGGLWFTGGDQSRTTAVMRPEGRRTAVLDACFKVLHRGGVIGGTSAGAAIMSDPMITGGQSRGRSTRDAEEKESTVRIAQGLGFLNHGGAAIVCEGLTDQHFLERGRMGRLIDALEAGGGRCHGYGVRENSALVVDRSSGRCEAIGHRAVCVLQLIPRSDANRASTARLSILSTGDEFRRNRSIVIPSSSRRDGRTVGGGVPGEFVDRKTVRDPWEMRTMEAALNTFALSPGTVVRENDRVRVRMVADSQTQVWLDETGTQPPCVSGLLIVVEPKQP